MNERRRARSASSSEWDRARRAYRTLIGDHDPAAAAIAEGGAIDLRPGGPLPAPDTGLSRLVVVSGPADLVELREIVETATGVGTWPTAAQGNAALTAMGSGALHTARLEIERPAALLGLLLAMDGLIEDRSPWGTWRTVVDTLAGRVHELRAVTIEARIVHPTSDFDR